VELRKRKIAEFKILWRNGLAATGKKEKEVQATSGAPIKMRQPIQDMRFCVLALKKQPGRHQPKSENAELGKLTAKVHREKGESGTEAIEQRFIKHETAEKTLNIEATIFKFT